MNDFPSAASGHQTPGDDPPARGVASFFVLTLAFTWSLQLPAVLAQRGLLAGPPERYLLPAGLGGFGPLVAALLLSRVAWGGPGVRALVRRLRAPGVGVQWYLVALGIFAAIHVAGVAVYVLCGGSAPGRWLYPPETGQHLASMVMMPLVEEPGWRGFALPRLQRRHGPGTASLLLGVVWALWHAMMFLLQGMTPLTFALGMVNIVAGSVIFSWIYNRTRGSLLLAIVAHVGVHLNNPYHALPDHPTPFVVYTAAMVVAAAALWFGGRGVFGRRPAT